jgi:hypothetical protein
MTSDHRHARLKATVLGYSDRELVQAAADALAAFDELDLEDRSFIPRTRADVNEAMQEHKHKAPLSPEARGSLRRFVLNKGIQDLKRHL